MIPVDYVIIGAGMAGLTLRHFLRSSSVVLLDPQPGRYKIGESIIPQHFFHQGMHSIRDRVKALPSASAKDGTLFVNDESVSYFAPFFDAQFPIHLDRREFEGLMREHWGIDVALERCEHIDLDRKLVRTDRAQYQVRRQIIDCSGPARLLARQLGIHREVWPAWASWSYYDVERTTDDRYWDSLKERGLAYVTYDNDRHCLVDDAPPRALKASHMTMLNRIRDGVWTWQIPLYHAKLLSFGVVTRHGPVSAEEYREVTHAALGAQYVGTLRAWDNSNPHNAFHTRNRFAWAAETFASDDWILVGDAAFFGDPVYSVGTGVSTNQAIQVAELLNEGDGWTSEKCAAYNRQTQMVFERAKRAYNHWYYGRVVSLDEVAKEIQTNFLNGRAFQVATSEAYVSMWSVALPPEQQNAPGYYQPPPAPLPRAGVDVSLMLRALVGEETLAGWRLHCAYVDAGRLELDWYTTAHKALRVSLAPAAATKERYRVVGSLAVSYRSTEDTPYELQPASRALLDGVTRLLPVWEGGVLQLLGS